MQFVEPIRDLKKVSQIKNLLRWDENYRDLLLFELGINSALRITDLLSLKVGDLYEADLEPKAFFDVKEGKTWKVNRITITPKVRETLKRYAQSHPQVVSSPLNHVFFKRKTYPLWGVPIGRKMSWLLISDLCNAVWLKWNYWNHTLRKTWGYQARMSAIPMEIIQQKLNHSSLAVTRRYLGITADEIMDACNRLDL